MQCLFWSHITLIHYSLTFGFQGSCFRSGSPITDTVRQITQPNQAQKFHGVCLAVMCIPGSAITRHFSALVLLYRTPTLFTNHIKILFFAFFIKVISVILHVLAIYNLERDFNKGITTLPMFLPWCMYSTPLAIWSKPYNPASSTLTTSFPSLKAWTISFMWARNRLL